MVDCNINDNKETLPEMGDAISDRDGTNETESKKDILAEKENLLTPGKELAKNVRSCTKSESPGSSILDASLQVQNEEDRSADEKVFFKSPTISSKAEGDVNASESQGPGGCRDSSSLDSTEQLDSIVQNESPVKVRPDDEEPIKRNDGVTAGELCGVHGETQLESCMVHVTGTEELKMGVKRCGSFLSNKAREENLKRGAILKQALMENETKEGLDDVLTVTEMLSAKKTKDELLKPELDVEHDIDVKTPFKTFLLDTNPMGEDESGTEEEQAAFMKELETFHKERCLEFKAPRFYGEPLNCLKLWRAVIRLGGYEQVTSCKLWRQVGESFKPPKTCTTVSWTFRCFYEKALLEYEKHKMRNGELPFTDAALAEPTSAGIQNLFLQGNQASGSGRARRDAAARAMQGWHSQRLLGNGEVGDPIIKEKNSVSLPKREKQLKSIGLKRKKPSPMEHAVKVTGVKVSKPHLETMVVDIGPPADWVKINVQKTKDCYEVYALVPGLLREEVRVQSDPAGRLVISGQPEQLDNPWGVAPFKKVVSLPSRIDPHQTSAVVTLHGQLFVRVPFEQSNM
ncbi:AT-rich interactive domain-containing protein 5-like isoform X1 [Solanum tuberosum]|uniref:AT-rich interactive domain-containing protein 5-like isoform X1 n=1 Tax=Solanum tuberosum TaxID=4113 RepID=UPI00073A037C|nr:PREDICTED: AT-rich interactive domain-containing protein 5-like isoform X1 [Solanum tuberosum]